jgi:hypothetical protein
LTANGQLKLRLILLNGGKPTTNNLKAGIPNSMQMQNIQGIKWLLFIILIKAAMSSYAQDSKSVNELTFTGFIKNLPLIKAKKLDPHPDWAIMQRQLMKTIEQSAPGYVEKFTQKDGTPYGLGPYDDVYEMFYNWPEMYAIGGSD